MIRITMADVKSKKTSDTIFVFGSGYSINRVKDTEWDIIRKHDSIAFNWFCKHSFEPTYFLIREQANLRSRRCNGETVDELIKLVNRYKNTVGIICDVSSHTKKAYRYDTEDRIKMPCVVVKDDKSLRYRKLKNMKRDPSKKGLIHGSCTMYNVLHLVTFLGYERIVFVGVDLYDSRYFWLGKNETRRSVAKKNRKYRERHVIASKVIKLVRNHQKLIHSKAYVSNRKSLLKRAAVYKPIGYFA